MVSILESSNEIWKDGKELRISQLESEMLHGTRNSFVILLKEGAVIYTNNSTKSTAIPVFSFYRFGKQLLQKLEALQVDDSDFLNSVFCFQER